MKAIVVTDQGAGTAGMTLVERPEPQAAINDVVVQVHASDSGCTDRRLRPSSACGEMKGTPLSVRMT